MELTKWPILGYLEGTQSNTYMPLICSVIDGYKVNFPIGYQFEFFAAIQEYNRQAPYIGEAPLKFTNLKTFQTFLKPRVERVIHGLSIGHFDEACDHRYHVRSRIQDQIMHGLDGFFNIFIPKLIEFGKTHSVTCDLRIDAPREDSHEEIEAHREFERRKAERLEREAPYKAAARAGIEAHREAAHREHPDRTVTDKWYAMDEHGQEDYSDEVNRQINAAGRDDPPFMTKIKEHTYFIDTNAMIEQNDKTKQRRLILKKPRWYYKDEKKSIPFSDEDNRKIVNGLKNSRDVSLENHDVYPEAGIRVNRNNPDLIDTIVYEGGKNKKKRKTKRRRSICVSRRHA